MASHSIAVGDFLNTPESAINNHVVEQFIALENDFIWKLTAQNFGASFEQQVEYIYNPLEYASGLHKKYLEKYCSSAKKVLFLGMNPGPWGMCQTGVPFGEVNAVRHFLKISGSVETPSRYHPSRPVQGLECNRSEVSGKRLWDLIQELSKGDPFNFFRNCALHNYCPLAFLAKSGKNVTPAELKADARKLLNDICDEFLYKFLKLLQVEVVVAIGKFAEKRTLETLNKFGDNSIKVVSILHPSPLNKQSNINWKGKVKDRLQELDIIRYFDEK